MARKIVANSRPDGVPLLVNGKVDVVQLIEDMRHLEEKAKELRAQGKEQEAVRHENGAAYCWEILSYEL